MKKPSAALLPVLLAVSSLLWSVPQAQAAEPPAVTFDVLEYLIVGNTVLPPDLVEQAVQAHMGPGKTLKDVEAARSALETAYQDAGYLSVVVSLPNQQVTGGEVTLEVVEASVEKLKITGAQYNLPSRIAQQMPSLAPGKVPYFPQMQEELTTVQRGDLQVTPLISAGSQPDQIQVELKVEDKPAVSGSVELNNKQSFNTSRGRIEAQVAYNNLFQRGHSFGLAWQYAPRRPSDANTLTGIYGFPVTRDDNISLSFTHSSSDTPTGTSLGGATLSRGTYLNTRWRHDLHTGTWPASQSTWAGLDLKYSRDGTRTNSGLTTEKPALHYITLGAGYDLLWRGASQTGLHIGVTTSTQDLAARKVDCEGLAMDQFECKRAGAKADFLVLKMGLDHTRDLGAGWRLIGRADMQLASGPLVSGEQYSLGGADTVRGYYDYEQAADMGWSTQLNLRTPDWFEASGWRMSGQVFVDRGMVLLQEALPGQIAHVHMGSTGLGIKIENGKGLHIDMDVARPLYETRKAADNGKFDKATGRSPRWAIRAQQEF